MGSVATGAVKPVGGNYQLAARRLYCGVVVVVALDELLDEPSAATEAVSDVTVWD